MASRTINLPLGLFIGCTVFYGVSLYYGYRAYSEFKSMQEGGSSGAQYSPLASNDEESKPTHTAFAGSGTRLGTDTEREQQK